MLRIFLLTAAYTMLFAIDSKPQSSFAEIELIKPPIESLKGMLIGDSIFLTVLGKEDYSHPRAKGHSSSTQYFYWILPDGSIEKIGLSGLDKNRIMGGITNSHNKIIYYYFEELKNSVLVKALEQERSSSVAKAIEGQIELPGKLLGSFVEKDLYLICDSKDDYSIRIIRIRDLKIASEQVFSVSLDLAKDKRKKSSFYPSGIPVRPAQASAPIKIINQGNYIYLCTDERYNETYGDFKTTVIKIDLNSGLVTNKSFFGKSQIDVASTVFADHVFRIVREKNHWLEIFDFDTGTKVASMNLNSGSTATDPGVYTRMATNNTIYKSEKGKGILLSAARNYIIIDSTSAGNLILTVGFLGTPRAGIPMIPSLGLVPVMLTGIANIAIHELNDTQYINEFSYLEGAIGKEFSPTSQTNLLFQQIDDYEIDQQNKKIKYELKGYLDGKHSTFAFYQERNSNKLKIIKFARK